MKSKGIINALIASSLISLCSCQKKETTEPQIQEPLYISEESKKVNEDYQQFRKKSNIGWSKDQASKTSANLSMAVVISEKTSKEISDLYNQYRSMNNIGFSKDEASQTASLLVYATIIRQNEPNIEEIKKTYNIFRSMNNIGFSKNAASNVSATLTIATILNDGNNEEVATMYKSYRSQSRAFSKDQASKTAAELTLATIIEKESYILERRE